MAGDPAQDFELLSIAVNGLVTRVAAGAGAYFAFQFEKHQRKSECDNDNVGAGNLALLTLCEISNVLRDCQRQVVDPWRGKPDLWLNFPANTPAGFDGVNVDVAGLTFVLENDPAKVQLAVLEQRRFHLVLAMIKQHSDLVLSEVFPKLTAAGVRLNEGRPAAEIAEILGVGIVRQLNVLTTGIVQNEDVKSCRQAFDQLRAALKVAYPKRKFLGLPAEAPATERQQTIQARAAPAGRP